MFQSIPAIIHGDSEYVICVSTNLPSFRNWCNNALLESVFVCLSYVYNFMVHSLFYIANCHCHCHYLRWRMPPFMRQCWGLQVGPMHETAGTGKLINAALLSLMRRVWVYAVLPSSWVNSSAPLVCRHDRVTREVRRVGLVGRDREGGILNGVVPVYCPVFNVSVSLGV